MTRQESLQALEHRLETELGATGKTYPEKVTSLEKRLPAPLWKQLQSLPTLPDNEFADKLASSNKQVGLFAFNPTKPATEAVWTEEQRSEARAKITEGLPSANTKRPTLFAKVAWWFYDQKRAIPHKAYHLSRWRWLVAVLLGLVGAFLGWSLGGAVLAAGSFLVWGGLALWLCGEQNLARVLWFLVRLLEVLWRGLPVLLLGLIGLVWWLVAGRS